jgi:hypothetical protein
VRSADFAALYSASFRCAYGDIAGDMRQALQAFVAMSLIYKQPTPVGAPLASPLIAFTVKIARGVFGNRLPDFSVITLVCCRDAISSISI